MCVYVCVCVRARARLYSCVYMCVCMCVYVCTAKMEEDVGYPDGKNKAAQPRKVTGMCEDTMFCVVVLEAHIPEKKNFLCMMGSKNCRVSFAKSLLLPYIVPIFVGSFSLYLLVPCRIIPIVELKNCFTT